MTYTISIDQTFATEHGMTLVQVSTLAAFMTLPVWTKTIAVDGAVWYQYADEKMAEDFPLLFGVPKRCYKNVTELAAMGFVELTKIGRDKYVRFTAKCADWGKVRNRTESPKMDQNSPKLDQALKDTTTIQDSIYNSNTNKDIAEPQAAGLFGPEIVEDKKQRGTTEPLCLFANSRYFDFPTFAACFADDRYAGIDLLYYHDSVADWSAKKGKKMRDWIATARGFIRSDRQAGKLQMLARAGNVLTPDAMTYLESMQKLRGI